MSASGQSEFGVSQVAAQMQQRLQRYLEAQYHIRDTGLIEERPRFCPRLARLRSILSSKLRRPIAGEEYAKLNLPSPVGETLANSRVGGRASECSQSPTPTKRTR